MWKLLAVLALTMLTPGASAQQSWEGIWLATDRPCNDSSAQEKAIRISRTELEGPTFSCRIMKITRVGKNSAKLSLRCTDGGPPQVSNQTLTLLDSGLLIRRENKGAQEELARCDAFTEAGKEAIRDRRKISVCDGAGCRMTIIEWGNLDSPIAWALGKTSPEDAELACERERPLSGVPEHQACIKAQLSKPAIKIAANCADGSTTLSGVKYKISDAAREGVLRTADMPAYWDISTPYAKPSRSGVVIMASWFRVLCPTKSSEWNMKSTN